MPKSLVEKICEACAGVDTVLKQGDNGEYAYLRILDISKALREKLFAAGVLIVPSDVECKFQRFDSETPGRAYTEASVSTDFFVTDGTEKFTFRSYGFACDMDHKCVGIAQTAALKSFLKRLAMIFGDYDDPEIRDERIDDLRPDLQRKIDEQTCITGPEVRAIYSAMKKGGRTLEEFQGLLKSRFGIDDPKQLQKQFHAQVMEWALNMQVMEWALNMPEKGPDEPS